MNVILTNQEELRELISDEIRKAGINRDLPREVAILTEKQLCEKLSLSLPTVIRYRTKGKIPHLRIGDCIRYEYEKVLEALRVKNKK